MKADVKKFILNATVSWVVCAVVLIFAYIFLLFPAQRKAAHLRNSVDSVRKEYDEASEFVTGKNLDRMRIQVAGLKEELERYLAPDEEAKSIAFRVSRIAEQSGIKGFSTKFKPKKMESVVDNCPQIDMSRIDISFKGEYAQFVRLINDLERHQPIVFVDSFSIVAADKGDELHDIKIVLKILIDDRKKQSGGKQKESTKT